MQIQLFYKLLHEQKTSQKNYKKPKYQKILTVVSE